MKYKVSKEELDALFREVYSTTYEAKENYTSDLIKREEYIFLSYKYKNMIKNLLISHLPFNVKIKEFSAYEGNNPSNENLFITGFDIEKKYRMFISVSESFDTAVKNKINSGINRILEAGFNTQEFLTNISDFLMSEIKKDFPFVFKKINSPSIQFYEENFIKLEYKIDIEGIETEISLWIEKDLVENADISEIIYSQPTSLGKKRLKKLKNLLKVDLFIQSKPVMIDLKKLKEKEEITLDLQISHTLGG